MEEKEERVRNTYMIALIQLLGLRTTYQVIRADRQVLQKLSCPKIFPRRFVRKTCWLFSFSFLRVMATVEYLKVD